eukprot:CAMPEP_0119147632 /NCGR_PEP_ID=MMETSP1310-20130426/40642_1 /TAXON_ID=464262 /ORGANISM="Genus nov. species nov., Strain RCC2339" /LENGTH=616 /DNA_ID=CAMNT_0007139613 /DNA_START=398 /DNA_END=2248 /DNA_ORIENTATION=+
MMRLAILVLCLATAVMANRQRWAVIDNTNYEGVCSVSTGSCDWAVGVWEGYMHLESYNEDFVDGFDTLPVATQAVDLACSIYPYQVKWVCNFGYREDNGEMESNCVWLPATFVDEDFFTRSTVAVNQVNRIPSFVGGYQFSNNGLSLTSCAPMDRAHTDEMHLTLQDGFSNIPSCPASPDVNPACTANSQNIFVSLHRQRPANWYHRDWSVSKSVTFQGDCSINTKTCDWIVGNWEGHIVLNSHNDFDSLTYELPIANRPQDINCTRYPYVVSYDCTYYYDEGAEQLSYVCRWGTGSGVDDETGFGFSTPFFVTSGRITSLEGGIFFTGDELAGSACTTYDRLDTDTFKMEISDGFSSAATPCNNNSVFTFSNESPDTTLTCQDDLGTSNFQRQWALQVRKEPASLPLGGSYYNVLKSAPTGTCSGLNNNCDILIGTWKGYLYTKAFPEQPTRIFTPFPTSNGNTGCSRYAYTIPVECSFHYREDNESLERWCKFSAATANDENGFSVGLPQYFEYSTVSSLEDGLTFASSTVSQFNSGCLAMDFVDSDSFVLQNHNGVNQCGASPDTNLGCTDNILSSVDSFFILERQRPASWSSASALAIPYLGVLAVLALRFF